MAKSISQKYDKGYKWDGNSEYGIALGINDRGGPPGRREEPHPRRTAQGDRDATGRVFATPGLVPLTYSKSDHYGFSGSEMVKVTNSGKTITQQTPIYVTTNTGKISIYTGKPKKIPALFTK